MALTVTPGGSADNSYVTLAEADAYFVGLRYHAWNGVADASQELALRQATQEIERLGGPKHSALPPYRARFHGIPYDTATPQALFFPRTEDTDADGDVAIPDAVKCAVCEQAAFLLGVPGPGGVTSGIGGMGTSQSGSDGLFNHQQMQSSGVASFSMDGASLTYGRRPSEPESYCADLGVCKAAFVHIRPYIRWGARIG